MLSLVLFAMTAQSMNSMATIFVGTYTDPNGSKGIYRVRLNKGSGALSKPELAAEATAPSYLCMRADGKFLYAVNEYSDGEASAYAVKSGVLQKLNAVKFDGRGPCHISIAPNGKWLFVSAYGGGNVTVLPIEANGSIGAVADAFKNSGSGLNQKRQESPHAHFAGLVGSHLYACDLGTDQVLHFDFDGKGGRLRVGPSGKTEPGAGPRHFAVSRDGRHLYVNNEMGMGVSVFSRDPSSGALRLVQTHTTLEGQAITPSWSTAAVKVHPKLPVVYVSNRGHNSITLFDIQPDGSLAWRSVFSLDVAEPRDFAIDPNGTWMVVGGQKSGELHVLSIDPKSGDLSSTSHQAKIAKPVCIVFAT